MKVGSFKIKTKYLIRIGIGLSVLFIVYSIVNSGLIDRYNDEILAFRADKNDYFKTSENSPIEDQINFKSLRFFEPDKKFRVKATLTLIEDSSFIMLLNNDGEKNKYYRYAHAVFVIDKKSDTLVLLRKAGLPPINKNYFLPFFDETNGDETYEGGRYIDITLMDITNCWIDFNLAYNPYCVYNYRYSCPIPPAENNVNFKILAGERMFYK